MKLKSTTIAIAAIIAVIGSICWWAAQDFQSGSQATSEKRVMLESHESSAIEQEIQDYIRWLHPRVMDVVNKERNSELSRRNAVNLLPHNLTPLDVQALLQFINGPSPADCMGPSWHGLVDSIINVIRRQESPSVGFTRALVLLYHQSPDPVLKDYAIQYLRHLYVDRDRANQHETDPKERELILVTLIDAASKTNESYSGTALMALDDATTSSKLKEEPETQAQLKAHVGELDSVLINAAASSETDKHCRISSIQLCAKRGLREILPICRKLAADTVADPNLRISAIAAIGQIGSLEQDRVLLHQLEQSSHRLACAAIPALTKLSRQIP